MAAAASWQIAAQSMSRAMQRAIIFTSCSCRQDAAHACAVACDRCAAACLQEEDVGMMARCIALDMDCAAMCRLAAAFLARESEASEPVCGLCAALCEMCADECATHEHEHCQACAQACRECGEACRQMAG
jgi:hypothetical protein